MRRRLVDFLLFTVSRTNEVLVEEFDETVAYFAGVHYGTSILAARVVA